MRKSTYSRSFSSRPAVRIAALSALAVVPSLASAADVTLTATDTPGTTSFNSGLHWSDGAAPSAANNYFVPSGLALRTPFDNDSVTFAGNSLTLGDNGSANGVLTFKNLTGATVTVNNVTLNRGELQNGGNAAGNPTAITFASNLVTLGAGGGFLNTGAAGRSIILVAPITGSGGLTALNGGSATLSNTSNNYSGLTTVTTNTTLIANDGAGLSANSALLLSSGVLGTTGEFTRALGTAAGQVQVGATGGFSAVGGPLVVALGGTAAPTALTLGSTDFAPTTLTLNNGLATGTLDFRNSINFNGNTAGINVATNTATISGVLSDSSNSAGLTKSGVGILALTAANTYTGQTNLTNSVLRATDGVGLPTASNLNLNGGIFESAVNFTRGLGSGAGQVQFGAGTTSGFSSFGADTTVAIGGTAAPTPLVWGTTDFFNPGAIILGSGAASNTTTLVNNVDLATPTAATVRTLIAQSNTAVVTGVISNSSSTPGTLAIEGNGTTSGTLILSGNNTYGGTTLIDSGAQGAATVRAISNNAFGTSLVQFNPGGNATTARLELANNVTIANNISLSGRNNTSVAVQNISGNNTLSGTTTINVGGASYIFQSDAGTLTLSGASDTATNVAIQSGAASANPRVVTLQGAGNGVVSGLIRDNNGTAGAIIGLTKAGTGTWTLTAANTFTGPTVVNAGTLAIGDGTSGRDGTLATSGVTVAAGATLNYNRFGTANSAGYVITGAGNVSKSGVGTQTLTAANTYTGTTVVQAGSLVLNNAAAATVLNAGNGGSDVQGGKLVFDYTGGTSPVSTVGAALTAGYGQSPKFSSGLIRSSTLAGNRTLGYGDNGTRVTVMYTLPGDANLSGTVDFNDFLILQNNFAKANTRFDQGNFNYDGTTDFNDFLILQNSFGQSLNGASVAFTSEQVAAITAFANNPGNQAVPEPASLAVVGLAAAGLIGRRRRTAK